MSTSFFFRASLKFSFLPFAYLLVKIRMIFFFSFFFFSNLLVISNFSSNQSQNLQLFRVAVVVVINVTFVFVVFRLVESLFLFRYFVFRGLVISVFRFVFSPLRINGGRRTHFFEKRFSFMNLVF